MRSSLALSALTLGASASIVKPHIRLPRDAPAEIHWFALTATSAAPLANGHIGQLNDGQCRIGGDLPGGQYRIEGGKLWDHAGRGCIVTTPEGQWQCDDHAHPAEGFDVDCKGQMTHKGSAEFYACPVNDHGEWNIYVAALAGQSKCVQITLHATGDTGSTCKSPSAPPPGPESPPPHKLSPPSPPHGPWGANVTDHCPVDLKGPFEFPHLIVPVDKQHPDTALGNKLNGTIGEGKCSIFNFDIKPGHAGKRCSLLFLLPEHHKLETSAYSLSGEGSLQFVLMSQPATEQTTWNNMGQKGPEWQLDAPLPLKPGDKWAVSSHMCPAGHKVAFAVCSTSGLALEFFQDFNPEPIGLYVRVC